MESLTERVAGLSQDKRELLEALLRKKRAQSSEAAVIRPREEPGRLPPLSFSQERLWLIDQIEPGTPAYNIPLGLRLTGELSPGLLARVFAEIVRRHEALRTAFAVQAGEPVQVIAGPGAARPALPLVDLSGLGAAQRDEQALRLARDEAARSFDLQRGPLLRLCAVRLAAREHLLFVTMHHIVSDGWSLGVLQREVGTLYAAFSAGRPSPLPELPMQYADFAVWQRRLLQGEALAGQLGWWKEELAGAPGEIALPTDRSRAPLQGRAGASISRTLSGGLVEAVRELARREGATPFMLLLATYQMLLYRLSGQEDVLVGTPVANRQRLETEGLIGFFVNTLVLRGRLASQGMTFSRLLQTTRETVLAAFEHQDLPFERLVEELVPERNLSVTPLFQAFFSLQTASSARLSLAGLALEALPVHRDVAQFDLSLDLLETGARLHAALEISRALFDVATGQRMLEAFVHLLRGALAAPERRIAEIPLLDEAQRHQLLREWNEPWALADGCGSILPLFERRAALAPDAPALSQGDRRLTYGELDRWADRLARRLRRRGVGPETRVAVVAERTPELIAAFLGILKAGGAYVPLDPAYPEERRAFMREDSGAALLLEPAQIESSMDDEDGGDRYAPEAGQLAYLLYTSGSTGRPKGVMISHGALARYAEAVRPVYGIGPADRVLQLCSTSFDTSLEEIVACLTGGAELVLRTDAMLESVATFLESCRAQGVTVLSLPTAYWHEIAAKLETEGLTLPPCLRLVIIGGERALLARVAAWRRSAPERPRLLNSYGVTESAIVSTATDLAAPSPAEGRGEVSIGRALPGTEILLLDREGAPVPIGTAGKLMIGGTLLARGYLGRPDLTAERFVPHPSAAEPGARLYRTGDLARALPDGRLEFAGRADRQVKVRGYRIETEEIEARLLRHPEVESAVVVVREDRPGEKLIAAYFVPRSFPGPAPAALRAFVRETLPDHMTPGAYVALAALPLTPNGKLDRDALPAPAESGLAGESPAAPSDLVEELLAGIWAEVLGKERVGIHDDFFALGGHSLLATQVVSRVRAVLGAEIPLRQLFEAPTIAELARVVRAARQEAPQAPIERVPRNGNLPLSFAQQRLWLIDQLEPGSPAYNIPSAVRLRGEVSPARLERIFAEIVRRHEALRTTFATRDGRPVQVIADPAPLPLPLVDLTGLADGEREARVRALAAEEARRPFDLQRGPLLRLALLRLAAGEHVLLITMHHIVSDGWSMGVLLREIAALAAESPLPELPVQYADFAVWQRGWLQGEALEAQLDSWKRRLAGAPHVLDLPTDRPRPAVQSSRGAVRAVDLPPELSAAIRTLCRTEGATPFMALLAAWATLLGRHAGQDDLLLGSPIAGRNRREIEDLIGFFVNTLVLRADLSGNPTFRELLGKIRAEALDAFSHQDLPFERLVEELVPERDLSRSPLFQVLFALQTAPAGELSLPGLSLEPLAVDSGVAKFDLSLTLGEGPAGFSGALEYNLDLFDGTTAERLLARFATLLASAAGDPERPLADLRLMDAAEERLLQTDLHRAGRSWALPVAVHDLFARQAVRVPDKVAAVDSRGALSYQEIEERSNVLAARLRSVLPGVRLDRRVGLLADPGAEVLIGMLGILKAGAGFVPVDPRHPDERLAWILEDAGCEALVTRRQHLERAARLGPRPLLGLDETGAGGTADAGEPRDPRELRALAYAVYTSGSTGRPKGVQISHESLVPMLLWGCEYLGLGEHTRVLQSLSFCFDFGIFEQLTTVLAGGTLVFPEEAAGDPQAFAREIVRHGIDTLHTTPAFARELAASGENLDSLAILHLGGEALPGDAVRRLREAAPGAVLYNGYGPTEATINSSIHRIGEDLQTIPIGRPSANNALYVLDPAGRLVPFGVRGELHVGGIGVARGYLGRPDLTAERFVPDPFGPEPGGRLYRTGDLVRYLRDGDIEFLGRIDQQVKLRGFRIEPGEIEAVLGSHPAVRACVVVPRKNVLVACVVLDPSDRSDPRPLLTPWLRERLPEHMVPAAFVALEAFPLTPNGKIDRKALPDPQVGQAVPAAPPSDPVEELIAGIWADVLGLDHVGVRESFFALGGHSLLATQVVSRLRRALGVEIPLRQLFETPTVADLARALRTAGGMPTAPPLVPVPRDSELPLSFAQQRLWVMDQLEPGSPAYNIPSAVRLRGEVSPALLERIFAEIVRRHEALRTTFAARDGRPVQVIAAELRLSLPVVDLSLLPHAEREGQALRLARDEARRPFDLGTGPLLRLGLLRLAAQEHVLLVTLHHIVSDGWSTGVLLREIAALSAAFGEGRPSPLPELPVQYADFAVWQRGWLQGEVLDAELASWKRRLAGAPQVLDLPTDRTRPPVQSSRGASRPVDLPPELSAAVRRLCRQEGLTPFMAMLAAWAVLLGRHAGQDDVLVGSPIAGRNRQEIEDLIGFFVNTLVLRADLSGNPAFRTMLDRVRDDALEAFSHQDLPFERLVEELVSERDLSRSPLFQVLFVLQTAPAGELSLPGLSLEPLGVDGGAAKFDLTLTLGEGPSGFSGALEHNTDLFDGTTAARLLARFAALLEGAAGDPGLPVGDLPILLPAERRQLLEWNDTGAAPAAGLSLSGLFAAQAARTPQAVALVHPTERLTYAELAARAGAVACRLRKLGVRPEDRVAVCLERSPDLIVALLGVLAAGGAYVPVDPAYPAERRALMLEDSGAVVKIDQDFFKDSKDRETLESSSSLPGHLAYLIYTSGSTGRPKAVAIEHRSAVALAGWARETFSDEELSGVVAATSVCFDLSVFEIFVPLAFGGTVLLADNALALPELPAAGEARLLNTVPSAAAELVRSGSLPPSVRTVCLAGEPLPADLAVRLYATGTVERVLNLYGPSEDTTYSTGALVPRHPERAPAIGRPIRGTRAHVVDRRGALVPPGIAGELWLAGGGLARGYLGRPELTAERFTPDPFGGMSGDGGGRVYRTGDLVRWSSGGELEFLGRIDHQVKLRGFRIELGEIETVLGSHPSVRACVVVPRGSVLVAYVVLHPADRTDRTDPSDPGSTLSAWLRERLPEHMVPTAFVALERLPLTPNGKVDRRTLPAPGRTDGPEHLRPRDALELQLVQIWEEVLGVPSIGVRDDFFGLGGHSLLAVRVTSRIQSRLGRSVPLASLLRHSTVERLAAFLREGVAPLARSPLVELTAGAGSPLFLVHPIGGEVLCYVPLARRLGRPVYGLQAGEEELSLEEMAALYLRHIREVQPDGPYLLGGWSLGGAVAFEMARQLEREGAAVERVILIDSFAPGAIWRDEVSDAALVAAFASDLARLLGIGGIALPEGFAERSRDEALAWLGAQAEQAGLLPPGLGAAELERRFATFAANHRAMARYQGGPCVAPLLLLRAAEPAAGEPDRGWERVAGQPVKVHELPGDHYTLLQEPAVEHLVPLVLGS